MDTLKQATNGCWLDADVLVAGGGPETAVACGADAEELENPAAYCRTYDTEDEVNDAAVAAIALDTAGDVASDDTENDYINPVHIDKFR